MPLSIDKFHWKTVHHLKKNFPTFLRGARLDVNEESSPCCWPNCTYENLFCISFKFRNAWRAIIISILLLKISIRRSLKELWNGIYKPPQLGSGNWYELLGFYIFDIKNATLKPNTVKGPLYFAAFHFQCEIHLVMNHPRGEEEVGTEVEEEREENREGRWGLPEEEEGERRRTAVLCSLLRRQEEEIQKVAHVISPTSFLYLSLLIRRNRICILKNKGQPQFKSLVILLISIKLQLNFRI